MKIVPELVWKLEGKTAEPLDPRLLPLLEAIGTTASLAGAVTACGISYRAAWGLLQEYRQRFGFELVRLERGRGASLTPAGLRLLGAHQSATLRLNRILPGFAVEIGPRRRTGKSAAVKLRIAASHDLALAALADALPAEDGLSLDLSFMGSLDALEEYAEGRADVAGFHVPISGCDAADREPFLRWLSERHDRLLRFVDRDQGLILPRRNPMQIRSFSDIATKGLRFVNRQRGSGTRLLIDQLLADEGVDVSSLAGYRREEFTHGAVAATVASGGAAVGFGLRAAAAEYGLSFVPLVRERYFFAVRTRDLDAPATQHLVEALGSPTFAKITRSLPGYDARATGTVIGIDAIVGPGGTGSRRT